MEISYRNIDRANPDELRKIAEINVQIPPLFDPHFQTDEKTILESIDQLQNKVAEDDFFEVVTATNEQIVGFHIVKKTPYSGDKFAGFVYAIWVDEKFRKIGIGTKLKTHAEEWAKKNSLAHIYTRVHKDNAKMLALNEKLGFELSHYQLQKRL